MNSRLHRIKDLFDGLLNRNPVVFGWIVALLIVYDCESLVFQPVFNLCFILALSLVDAFVDVDCDDLRFCRLCRTVYVKITWIVCTVQLWNPGLFRLILNILFESCLSVFFSALAEI